jgi:hypothetical protein
VRVKNKDLCVTTRREPNFRVRPGVQQITDAGPKGSGVCFLGPPSEIEAGIPDTGDLSGATTRHSPTPHQ